MTNKDLLVATLVEKVERGESPLPFPVTLYTDGFFACGVLVSENRYLELSLQMIEKGLSSYAEQHLEEFRQMSAQQGVEDAHTLSKEELLMRGGAAGKAMRRVFGQYLEKETKEESKNYVHLENASVYIAGGEAKVKVWRCQIAAVKGFSLGRPLTQ